MTAPLDAEFLRSLLPQCVTAHIFDTRDSTNTALRELADGGAPAGTLVAASAQTAGRGRMGRSFFSPAGTGVYFSLLLRCEPGDSAAALITAAAALAAAEACEVIFYTAATIKWVNDVLVGGKKVAGILAESFFTDGFYTVLGTGVNIIPPPDGFPKDLGGAGSILPGPPLPELARERFVAETVRRVLGYTAGGDLSLFADLYRSRCDMAGKKITVTRASERYAATALGIDQKLSLSVMRENGVVESISYGEVTLHNESRQNN